MVRTRGRTVRTQLLHQSREAALNAVQTFNNPLTTFKTETFIVLMVIAWTYMLHAYYRRQGVEYRYSETGPGRRTLVRTSAGGFKYWELERCLNETACPLDPATKSNLRFLIGLRHEIEHHASAGVDDRLAGRYLACCLNYERAITEIFGERHSLGAELRFTIQFRDLTAVPQATEAEQPLPANVARYIQEFDEGLPEEEYQSPHFSYGLLFTRKLKNRRGQADRVIEFIAADSDLAQTINEQWVIREVERHKLAPSEIVKLMQEEGYPRFRMHEHTQLWRQLDAKDPGKGYGVEVAGRWLWYERWVEVVREHCATNAELYGPVPRLRAS